MEGWNQITEAIDRVAREDGPEAAAELVEYILMRFDDSRLLRILGDYEGEAVINTSIKGMLLLILNRLISIDDKLSDHYTELTGINSSAAMLAKYSELRSTPNEQYVRQRYGELRQSYQFRRCRQVASPDSSMELYEFCNPVARIQSEHNGITDVHPNGAFVRVAQNHQLGLNEYVYTSFVFTWWLDGQQVAPVLWNGLTNTLWFELLSQPYIPYQVGEPWPEAATIDSKTTGHGYVILRDQLRYNAHDYLYANIRMYLRTDDNDPQIEWFQSGRLQCQLDIYTGWIQSLE